MAQLLKINKSVDQGLKAFLESLLKEKKVCGVITLKKNRGGQGIGYSLITRPEELNDALPLFPLMPANSGKILSRLTLRGPFTEPVAVVLKPCELRAFIELVKRKQGSLDNYFFISQTCPGVYPLEMSIDGDLNALASRYREQMRSGPSIPEIRPACRSCLHFTPHNADIIVSLIAEADLDRSCSLFLNSKKGEALADGMEGEKREQDLNSQELARYSDHRKTARQKLFDELGAEMGGITGLIKLFGKCIGCHACGNACPICYCDLCFFESQPNESRPNSYQADLEKKGAARIPAGTLFYHVGRMAHMSVSCVGCGMCMDVCPVNIPVGTIFSRVGELVQKTFEYVPGVNLEDPLPVAAYKEEEFTQVGEQ